MTTDRRAVVTGMGVKTPAGCTVADFWDEIFSGRSSARTITRFDTADLRVRFACEVRDFMPAELFDHREQRRLDRLTQLGIAAALDALADSGVRDVDGTRASIVFGTGTGGLSSLFANGKVLFEKGPDRVSPLVVPMLMSNATPAVLAMQLGWTGPNFAVAAACASGAFAIGEATTLVRSGRADVVLAGGGEATVERFGLAAFGRTGSLSQRNDAPELASRPFDIGRDGYVMAEGAAFVVIEERGQALRRGATILAEVVGYAQNTDAFHITAPPPGGDGAYACMRAALAEAGLAVGELGHINAHGTSTELNDAAEGMALCRLFDEAGNTTPVTSSKGVLGHMMGGAGAAEAVAAILAMRRSVVPPTANLVEKDPAIKVDIVQGEALDIPLAPVMSNSFGFGGHNAVLVFAPDGPA